MAKAFKNAVASGFGEDLKNTFMKIGSDELIDVNPAPLLEFLTCDHPSMYNRIKAIHAGMEALQHREPGVHAADCRRA